MSVKDAKGLIKFLEDNDLTLVLPDGEELKAKHAGLFYLNEFNPEAEDIYQEMLEDIKEMKKEIRDKKKEMKKKSQVGAEAVNLGFILEKIAPCLTDYKFEMTDSRSLFDPIDYVIFEGLSKKNKIEKIIFADIKTGKARLGKSQREIKRLVESKNVKFDIY